MSGIESVHPADTVFFIWFTFPKVLSVSQSKAGSASCALGLIENRHTMLSAETTLNKQWGEKQTAWENQWNSFREQTFVFNQMI